MPKSSDRSGHFAVRSTPGRFRPHMAGHLFQPAPSGALLFWTDRTAPLLHLWQSERVSGAKMKHQSRDNLLRVIRKCLKRAHEAETQERLDRAKRYAATGQ